MTDFDSVFHVIWLEQQEMISIEEIIELQKREKAAQKAIGEKQRQLAQKASQRHPDAQRQSFAKKGKEKGITINEGAPQATQSVTPKNAPRSKKDGKRWGRRQRLHLLLGSVLARVEHLLWSLFL